jgi:hypothetical protein
MSNVGVNVQCRVIADIADSETHDRYILSQNLVYDTPPLNVINEKLGHMKRITDEKGIADLRKRFEKYWIYATSIEKVSTKDRD